MKFSRSIIPFLFCLYHSPAFGEWKFSGLAAPYINALSMPSTTVTPTQKSGFVTEIKFENKLNSNWRLRGDIFLRNDFLAKDAVERFQWNPRNLYLQRKFNSLTARVGYQIQALDGPDIVNPADVVNAKNWIDPTAPVTLGSAGLSLSQEIKSWTWEIFYIPRQTTPILPGAHSPWLPRKDRVPIESDNTVLKIPDNVQYKYLNSEELNHALSNNVSIKLQRKTEKLETQLLFYDGLAQIPFLLTQINATLIAQTPKQILLADSPVKLIPLYYRQQAAAATFVIPLDTWVIRAGINWLKPYANGDKTPGETTTAVVGVEKNVETKIGLITGIFQYIRQQRQVKEQISFLRSIFEEAWTLGARIPWGEETQFFLGGLYDQVGKSSLYSFGATHRLSTSWSVELGAKYVEGPKETLLGLYSRYDSYQARFVYYW
jgi:hypothetical protein